ncbi:MAG TPA: TetR/AcrR family transcriptional regulator [Microlunatus sp.]
MSDSGIGLREIKKQMTRGAIADAALKLALEHGLDRVTIEEIARIAFVSPRTFSNYFSCKEEAVIASGARYWEDVINGLADRPNSESPLEAMRSLLLAAVSDDKAEQLQFSAEKLQLSSRYPTLRPFETAQYSNLEDLLRESIAQRTGTDTERDLYPWLVATTVVGAMKAAMALWLALGAEPGALRDLVESAFDQVIDGLQPPAAQSPKSGVARS